MTALLEKLIELENQFEEMREISQHIQDTAKEEEDEDKEVA